ncbi:hypothetical protein O3M35_011022 [Rhynocoris fuscipes]|uniref:UBX domain-containing protein n=1 Tax=Rhynocoris fuscipes TaxID=488301 RepID=A0AAW1CUU2_9HEMI
MMAGNAGLLWILVTHLRIKEDICFNLSVKIGKIFFTEYESINIHKGARNFALLNVVVSLEYLDMAVEGIFKTDASLWKVLLHLGSKNMLYEEGTEPGIQYGNDTFSGIEELSDTKLEHLGATPGSRITLKYVCNVIDRLKKRKRTERKTIGDIFRMDIEEQGDPAEGSRKVYFNPQVIVYYCTQLEDYPYVAEKRTVLFRLVEPLNKKHQVLRSFFHISFIEIGFLLCLFDCVGFGNENKLLNEEIRDYIRYRASLNEGDILLEKKTALRIKFPKGYVLQSIFTPKTTIYDVKHTIKTVLKKKNISFYLYKKKPYEKLINLKLTLQQANLIPTGELYFVTSDFTFSSKFIRPELIKHSMVNHSIACKVAMMWRLFPSNNLNELSRKFEGGDENVVFEGIEEYMRAYNIPKKKVITQGKSKSKKRNEAKTKSRKTDIDKDVASNRSKLNQQETNITEEVNDLDIPGTSTKVSEEKDVEYKDTTIPYDPKLQADDEKLLSVYDPDVGIMLDDTKILIADDEIDNSKRSKWKYDWSASSKQMERSTIEDDSTYAKVEDEYQNISGLFWNDKDVEENEENDIEEDEDIEWEVDEDDETSSDIFGGISDVSLSVSSCEELEKEYYESTPTCSSDDTDFMSWAEKKVKKFDKKTNKVGKNQTEDNSTDASKSIQE